MISYTFTNSSSPSQSPTPSKTAFTPLLIPCPTLSPENPNIILVQRDYLYGSGIFIMFVFFVNILYINWIYGKYTSLKKKPFVVTHNPSNIV